MYRNRFVELGYKNLLLLDVRVLSYLTCGVELGSTNTIAVSTSNE